MKSSLASIGAMELSNLAQSLETASKNNEFDYCEKHFPKFLEQLRSLNKQLATIFIMKQESALPRTEGNVKDLREHIDEAQKAIVDFEQDLAMEKIAKLFKYDFGEQTNELLENSHQALRDFDFDTALEYLKQIDI
jgi:HPt (histidine-containing phosphotransfer) domain-containing protein